MAENKTITLQVVKDNTGRMDEPALSQANGVISPGDLLELQSTGKVVRHSVAGGFAEALFALEDENQGKGYTDNYADGDTVLHRAFKGGEQVHGRLNDGETAVIGDKLESAGNGKLKVVDATQSSGQDVGSIICVALEAIDMSSSAGADPLGGFIRCRVAKGEDNRPATGPLGLNGANGNENPRRDLKMGREEAAVLDSFASFGRGGGGAARLLLNNKMNPKVLRPIAPGPDDDPSHFVANATLQKEEWKQYDAKVVQVATQRPVGIADLRSRGLVFPLGARALGTMILETETESDMTEADVTMDGNSPGADDRVEYELSGIPVPVMSKGFTINARVLDASRTRGTSLDTSQAGVATRKVVERLEKMYFQGVAGLQFGGGQVYGLTTHPSVIPFSIGTTWVTDSGENILDDVRSMKQKSIDALHFGPWILYVPTEVETALDDDFKANSDKTIRARILEIKGIVDVKVADFLPAGKICLVQMTEDTVRLVEGFKPMMVDWLTEGGWLFHFRIISIAVPQIRADHNGRCGVVLGTYASRGDIGEPGPGLQGAGPNATEVHMARYRLKPGGAELTIRDADRKVTVVKPGGTFTMPEVKARGLAHLIVLLEPDPPSRHDENFRVEHIGRDLYNVVNVATGKVVNGTGLSLDTALTLAGITQHEWAKQAEVAGPVTEPDEKVGGKVKVAQA